MAKLDPHILAHLEWMGFVQPTGLVVSAPALVRAGVILERHDVEGQNLLRAALIPDSEEFPEAVGEPAGVGYGGARALANPRLTDFRAFASKVLDWSFSPKGFAGTEEARIPAELEVVLPDGGEVIRPDYAVRTRDPESGQSPWQLLVQVVNPDADFDHATSTGGSLDLTPHSRMERLLRQTGVPAGLLVNGSTLRLISAPRGESSGWMDFSFSDMLQTAGRPICTAMRLLLSQNRLLTLPRHQRLPALLKDSRAFQNEVSEKLAEQVLHALYELLRGFQAAHDASKGELLGKVLAEHPDEVYRALLTVILRLVFLLYAEERDMFPGHETFQQFYSLAGLYQRLREDAALFPDTMDQRFGAWAQLLSLFRMIHDGAAAPGMHLTSRRGVLFDPNRFPFLEGRETPGAEMPSRYEPPLVPDGTVYRALEKLLVLDGERISYRALDVEQIGSVYETMMGFRLEVATGRSITIKPSKRNGAPTTVDLEAMLDQPAKTREKWFLDRTGRKLGDKVKKNVLVATNVGELHAALNPLVDHAATPDLIPKDAMVLQPSEERRRSGSHYTPRALTAPIVKTTLDPILARLPAPTGLPPTAATILDLKVSDAAMGSGAFLVEACRYLADVVVESWRVHGDAPKIPADEDEVVFARRLVAKRCLYGVDRNPVAVDLAKMSLWLVTLAKDHPLTFVDHALRHGDSLVGLDLRQIRSFHWAPTAAGFHAGFGALVADASLTKAAELREAIRAPRDDLGDDDLRRMWEEADRALVDVRLVGDLLITAFFNRDTAKARDEHRRDLAAALIDGKIEDFRDDIAQRRRADPPLAPFHWELEFPEVFDRPRPGVDAIVGNPPFAGKNSVSNSNVAGYPSWLKECHAETHGNADLVAHFFRRAFDALRDGGAFGLIATNTIAQGDTRSSGFRWICTHGGEIFAARRRLKWPGQAAVVVSVVHAAKNFFWEGPRILDGREVETITAYLVDRGGHDDPVRLAANEAQSFQGSIILGMGFTFDDTDKKGVATPIATMQQILREHPACEEVIRPYIGGQEVNVSPTHAPHRFVINFGERTEEECRRRWPELMAIVEAKVKPARIRDKRQSYRRYWWIYAEKRRRLYAALAGLKRVLVVPRVGQHGSFTFLPTGMVFSEQLIVFPFETHAAFCALQARPHEIWARCFGSSMKDDLRYTPSDCFETFPFPADWPHLQALEAAGREYFEHRAGLMVKNGEGLTKTYNRFHDPEEDAPEILTLRSLHSAMDRAVLDAYGWTDIAPECEFLLDYEIDEETWSPRKKKPYRYRWPDAVQAEVLGRLLELNAERAQEEARAGAKPARNPKRAKRPSKSKGDTTGDLFP